MFVVDSEGVIRNPILLNSFTYGLAASRQNPLVFRRVGSDGLLYGTQNGGVSWSADGALPAGSNPYDAAFDPNSILRIAVAEHGNAGVRVTNDGGLTWSPSSFDFTPTSGQFTMADATFSADGSVIWVLGHNADEACCGNPSQGRHIWRSADGGASFTSVVVQDATILLGNPLVPHPTNPNVVYWTDRAITDPYDFLFRYDHATGMTTRMQLAGVFKTFSMAFNPIDSQYIYFGLYWP